MSDERPCVVTIAGFDPSGGAGVLADVKTFEENLAYSFAVCTAITYQTEREFLDLRWIGTDEIISQLEPLLKRGRLSAAKIGIVQDLEVVERVVFYLREHNPGIPIVWDPVMRASAGYQFHENLSEPALFEVCSSLSLVTPNAEEMKLLLPRKSTEEGAVLLSSRCPVLLKSAIGKTAEVGDVLYERGTSTVFRSPRLGSEYHKHGSGCVLSAAITASLAYGISLDEACLRGRRYVEKFLKSTTTLLGYHSEV